MKLRDFRKMPVFLKAEANIIGEVVKGVVDDNFELLYLILEIPGQGLKMLDSSDFIIMDNTVVINDKNCIKSYAHGEELSIYDLKRGDIIYNTKGQELGVVSDFLLSRQKKKVWGMEISSGILSDVLEGRKEIPIEQILWKSETNGMLE